MHSELVSSIQTEASQCVKCGLCLPYCPTYNLTQNENESPRGRIALMQNLATEALSFSPKAHEHIDNCLSCKECERVCPAQVPYEDLLLNYRAWEKPRLHNAHVKNSWMTSFFEHLVTHPKEMLRLAKLLWLIEKLGLRALAQKLGIVKLLGLTRLNALLPRKLSYPAPLAEFYPAKGTAKKGTVALFTGCLSSLFDTRTNQDAVTVLQYLGYDVHVPKTQNCCGAIASHAGDASTANKLFQTNLNAFSNLGTDALKIDHIITTASGCGSMLKNNSESTNKKTGFFSIKIIDISDFLDQAIWSEEIVAKLNKAKSQFTQEKIAIHTPCTLRNGLKKPMVSQNLLNKLGLDCHKLQTHDQCCGSAGTHMLSHPETSEKLLDNTLIHLDKIAPTRLVTSNIGCALHFQKRFTEQNTPIIVCHPISLFAEMLANR